MKVRSSLGTIIPTVDSFLFPQNWLHIFPTASDICEIYRLFVCFYLLAIIFSVYGTVQL